MAVMTGTELAHMARRIAEQFRTLYVMGGFGAPLTPTAKERYTGPNANPYNRQPERTEMIRSASADTFAFDCVGLIKGILWGWDGDLHRVYGGANYASNGVPDIGANTMIQVCTQISDQFDTLVPGEVVWKKDHIGVYLGDGLAAECTPAWKNGVQLTAVSNIGRRKGYHSRTWTKHGRLPYVDYSEQTPATPAAGTPFLDVQESSYAYPAIRWCYEHGITKGTGKNSFSPDAPCTRAMMAVFLKRLADVIERKNEEAG